MPDDISDVEFSDTSELRRDIILTLMRAAEYWDELSEEAREDLTHAAEDVNLASDATLMRGIRVNFGHYVMSWEPARG